MQDNLLQTFLLLHLCVFITNLANVSKETKTKTGRRVFGVRSQYRNFFAKYLPLTDPNLKQFEL